VSRKPASFIFSTTDFFGNLVNLTQGTWDSHITVEHPQMVGYHGIVQDVIEDPEEIRPSTLSDTGIAFISAPGIGPRAEGIRVLVNYGDTQYEKGSSTGNVMTAYPIDVVKYGYPQLGPAIYKKGGRK
jgi:hypothetical protein